MKPVRFIGESIEVHFDQAPKLEKKPGCPHRFVWREKIYRITEILSEWHDYGRKGRMSHNMRPEHLAAAKKHGSWGVGRHYFRVGTDSKRIFDLYYDRAPKKATDRKGKWTLFREMSEDAEFGKR